MYKIRKFRGLSREKKPSLAHLHNILVTILIRLSYHQVMKFLYILERSSWSGIFAYLWLAFSCFKENLFIFILWVFCLYLCIWPYKFYICIGAISVILVSCENTSIFKELYTIFNKSHANLYIQQHMYLYLTTSPEPLRSIPICLTHLHGHCLAKHYTFTQMVLSYRFLYYCL